MIGPESRTARVKGDAGMRLKNKKTGEVGNLALNVNPNRESYSVLSTENGDTVCGNLVLADYNSLAELTEEWEDMPEEPRYYYFIRSESLTVGCSPISNTRSCRNRKEIGNYFETEEETEKAIEKIKAWKRLRAKGFRFANCEIEMSEIIVPEITIKAFVDTEEPEALNLVNLLFGGEE